MFLEHDREERPPCCYDTEYVHLHLASLDVGTLDVWVELVCDLSERRVDVWVFIEESARLNAIAKDGVCAFIMNI